MIVLGKHRVGGVLPLEHPRRVRHPDVEAAVRRVLPGGLDHRRPRMLLEDVPDHLDGVDLRLALHELDGLVQPADRRAERRAPRENLSFALQVAQRAPQLRLAHVLHLHVVDLEHVDVVGLEPLEAAIDGHPHVRGVGAHRQLGLSAAILLRLGVVDVVADFRPVDDLVSPATKCLGELFLGAAVPVGVGGVEEGDAELVVRAAQHRHRLGVRLLAPPAGGDRPGSEADFAHANRRAWKDSVLHGYASHPCLSSVAARRAK